MIINQTAAAKATSGKSLKIFILRILMVVLIVYVHFMSVSMQGASLSRYFQQQIWGLNDHAINGQIAPLNDNNSTNRTEDKRRTLHVIQCLSGNSTDFIDEWEINLKSVVMNSPIDSNLHVHIIADNKAYTAVKERLELSEIASSLWRNELTITVNNVESKIEEWRATLSSILSGGSANQRSSGWFDGKIGMGGYFRLFAHKIILEYTEKQSDEGLHSALYMDTDVVVISNLNHFQRAMDKIHFEYRNNPNIQQVDDPSLEKEFPLITWRENSGFMAMDIANFDRFWNGLGSLSRLKNHTGKISDQGLITTYQNRFSRDIATLPDEWFVHIGHGYRRSPQLLFDRHQKAGFLHFTGYHGSYFSPPGIIKYCHQARGCNQNDLEPGGDVDKFDRTWGRADHYTKLTWTWVRYQGGESRIAYGDEGYEARVELRTV